MDDKRIYNVNVLSQDVLLPPEQVKQRVPITAKAQRTVLDGRTTVERILDRSDHRLMVVVGPCSIHDPAAAHDYAQRLQAAGRNRPCQNVRIACDGVADAAKPDL